MLGKSSILTPPVVKLALLMSFTTRLSKKKLNKRLSISTNVEPSAAVPVKYDRACMMVPFASWTLTNRGTVILVRLTMFGPLNFVCQLGFIRLKNSARWIASANCVPDSSEESSDGEEL